MKFELKHTVFVNEDELAEQNFFHYNNPTMQLFWYESAKYEDMSILK